MAENLAVKALSVKKKGKLTSLETQQISDLQKAYGKNNIISAIRFAKSAKMQDIAHMLLQHCGVRPVLAPLLRDLIPNKTSAEKTFSSYDFQVACRLANATRPIEGEIENASQILLSLWKNKVFKQEVSKDVAFTLRAAIRKYGIPLAERGVQAIPANTDLPERCLIELYQGWLSFASTKNWAGTEDILKELGNSDETVNWGIPEPISIRLNKYFEAKANRAPNREESCELWSLLQEHTIDETIHAMSCVRSSQFSVRKVQKQLTPKNMWGLYELDGEEKIEALFRRQLGRAPSEEEVISLINLQEEYQINLGSFISLLHEIPISAKLSIELVRVYLEDWEEKRQEENF